MRLEPSLPAPPPLGYPVPNSDHAVSVQLSTWQDMRGMVRGERFVKDVQQVGYPRSFINIYVKQVFEAVVARFANPSESCLIFPAHGDAVACKAFLASPKNGNMALDDLHICAVDSKISEDLVGSEGDRSPVCIRTIRLYACFFPLENVPQAIIFWRLTGMGISSRLAEDVLEHIDSLRRIPSLTTSSFKHSPESLAAVAMAELQGRIAHLLERARIDGPRNVLVSSSDVYLYQTGMAAIYHCNQLVSQSWGALESIVFGFPYELTLKMVQTYGRSCKFYGLGTPEELDELENYLAQDSRERETPRAVWCECASNPLLRTVDFDRLRRLANHHKFLIVVDETIGSFANVDMLGVADIIVTSLTKSFSGFADVMGGSIVLNPTSPFYSYLKRHLDTVYRNNLYGADAVQLALNSRGFLPRMAKMNSSALALVSMLHPYVGQPNSTLTNIYHPSICWSRDNYHDRMRPATTEFSPGYGGLFTLEFLDTAAAAAFFDALNVHKGPSLGANLTLAQPYVQTVFWKEIEWAASYGLRESIVRISVGLEDKGALVRDFKRALACANSRAWVKPTTPAPQV